MYVPKRPTPCGQFHTHQLLSSTLRPSKSRRNSPEASSIFVRQLSSRSMDFSMVSLEGSATLGSNSVFIGLAFLP